MIMSCAARERLVASRKQEISTLLTPDISCWNRQKLDVCRMEFEERRCAWIAFGYSEVQQALLDRCFTGWRRWLEGTASCSEGDLLLPVFATANRDCVQFPNPDRFVIRHSPLAQSALGIRPRNTSVSRRRAGAPGSEGSIGRTVAPFPKNASR